MNLNYVTQISSSLKSVENWEKKFHDPTNLDLPEKRSTL